MATESIDGEAAAGEPVNHPREGSPRGGAESTSRQRAGRSWLALVIFFSMTLTIFAADQALKYLTFNTPAVAGQPIQINANQPKQTFIPPHSRVTVVPHLLSLKLTMNTGAVFGLGDGWQWFFIAISILAVGVLLRLFWVSPANAWPTHLALALILAGDLGNLYDRLMFHAVRDMLLLFPGVPLPFGLRWPQGHDGLFPWVFNIADAALLTGVALVLVIIWNNERPPQNAQSSQR